MGKKIFFSFLAILFAVSLSGCLNRAGDVEIGIGDAYDQEEGGKQARDRNDEQEEKIKGDVDTNEWRVYKKESKNLRFRFHDDWYYARDSEKEVDRGYELYLGFAKDRERLEKGAPYPIEFVIVPSKNKLDYMAGVSYATGTQRGDKFYFFATSNKDEYEDMVLAMAASLESLDDEVMADYRDENILFSYPKLWEQPKKKTPKESGRMHTEWPVRWMVSLGLMTESETNQEVPIFSFWGYNNKKYEKILKDLKNDESAQIEEEKVVNGNQAIIFTSDGRCRDIHAYVFNEGDMVDLEGLCAAGDDSMEEVFYNILDSFDFTEKGKGQEAEA